MTDAPHRRLLAWQLARALTRDTAALTCALPAELAPLGGQIDRAAAASLRAIVEGARAPAPGAMAAAFACARGEMTELEASLDAFELLGLGPTADLRARADRVGTLLRGLMVRAEAGTTA